MKIGLQVLLYNVDLFLDRMLENCGPFVDRIYAAYNPLPHADYNPDAQRLYRNRTDLSILTHSRWANKITLLRNDCTNEVDQRNLCLNTARSDGMDFMIVQDADEFYHAEDYERNIREIKSHPECDFFSVPWHVFWKSTDYVLQFRTGALLDLSPPAAVNCRRPLQFQDKRGVTGRTYHVLPGVCYHLAYVMNDEAMLEKVLTWSHSGEFDRDSWYLVKWKLWHPETRWLNPVRPASFLKALPFHGQLPEVLIGFPNPEISYIDPTVREKWRCIRYNTKHIGLELVRRVKGALITPRSADLPR